MSGNKPPNPPPPLTKVDIGNILSMIEAVNIPFNQLEAALALKVKLVQHHNYLPDPAPAETPPKK